MSTPSVAAQQNFSAGLHYTYLKVILEVDISDEQITR